MSTLAAIALSSFLTQPIPVAESTSVQLVIPEKRLAEGSMLLAPKYVQFQGSQLHSESYFLLQKMAYLWKEKKGITHFLAYAKTDTADALRWEIAPYSETQVSLSQKVSSYAKGFVIFYRAQFGGYAPSLEERENEYNFYQENQAFFSHAVKQTVEKTDSVRNDFLCNEEQRKKQLVFEGSEINIYYDYAPLGSPLGENEPQVHLLLAPKAHRENFTELTQSEYVEMALYAEALTKHYTEQKQATCYHMHRTGRLIQSVWHMHWHFIATPKERDGMGKISLLRKMIFGGKVLSKEELQKSVSHIENEVAPILAPIRQKGLPLTSKL